MHRETDTKSAPACSDQLSSMGYVVFKVGGAPILAWRDQNNGSFFCEATGKHIVHAVGAVPWYADRMH